MIDIQESFTNSITQIKNYERLDSDQESTLQAKVSKYPIDFNIVLLELAKHFVKTYSFEDGVDDNCMLPEFFATLDF